MKKYMKGDKKSKALVLTLIVALIALGSVSITSFADQGAKKKTSTTALRRRRRRRQTTRPSTCSLTQTAENIRELSVKKGRFIMTAMKMQSCLSR